MSELSGNRCETCRFWDEDGWGCKQQGVIAANGNPHDQYPDRVVVYGKRKWTVFAQVGPFFGCVHWRGAL